MKVSKSRSSVSPVVNVTHKKSERHSAGVIIFFVVSKYQPSAQCVVIISVTNHSDKDYSGRVQT